jgi:PAS domain S-box-containing protein
MEPADSRRTHGDGHDSEAGLPLYRKVEGLEDLTRLLIDGVRDHAIFMLDPSGHVTTWNAGARRMKGYTVDEVLGRHFSLFYPPESVAAGWPEEELRIAAAEGRLEDEGWRIRKDGSKFWANVVITALRDEAGTLRGFGKVTRDVTERRLLEQAAVEAAEAERRRLSYELHDDLGQRLAGASVLAYTLEGRLRDVGSPEATAAARLGELLRDSLAHARALSHALAPVDLLDEGLDAALHRLCEGAALAYSVRCRVDIERGARVGDPVVATGLFRIAQEAVNNAGRHAGATEIAVALARRGGELRLTVHDDGAGVPREALSGRGPGLGLRTMRSRAAALGGVLTVTGEGGGTTVTCVLPAAVASSP